MTRPSCLALLALLVEGTAGAVDITQCGQEIPPGAVGELRTDLVCPPLPGIAVYLRGGGTLNLNGHTIAGTSTAVGGAIQCSGLSRRDQFIVNGPGLLTNFDIAVSGGGGSLRLQGVTARGNSWGLTYKAPRIIELLDVDMSNNLEYGITARGGRMRGWNVIANDNGIGGVWGPVQEMVNLTATGNGSAGGVYAVSFGHRRVLLIDSTITGNHGLDQGFDVLATLPVALRNTTCGQGARVRVRRDGAAKTTTIRRRLGCAGD